jgi:hypothetical protein
LPRRADLFRGGFEFANLNPQPVDGAVPTVGRDFVGVATGKRLDDRGSHIEVFRPLPNDAYRSKVADRTAVDFDSHAASPFDEFGLATGLIGAGLFGEEIVPQVLQFVVAENAPLERFDRRGRVADDANLHRCGRFGCTKPALRLGEVDDHNADRGEQQRNDDEPRPTNDERASRPGGFERDGHNGCAGRVRIPHLGNRRRRPCDLNRSVLNRTLPPQCAVVTMKERRATPAPPSNRTPHFVFDNWPLTTDH